MKEKKFFITVLGVLAVSLVQPCYAFDLYTNRTAWLQAAGGTVMVEDFQGFPSRHYLTAGLNTIGLLTIDIERASGNLITESDFMSSVNGTSCWRIETATWNGSTPPVTPAILFNQPVYALGADWHFYFTPRSTLTINNEILYFSSYLSTQVSFLGIISDTPFTSVEFDVVSPFNDIFYADNVSFCSVPEPATTNMLLIGAAGVLLKRNQLMK